MGEMVEFPGSGHVCSGYLALPEQGHGPGVVVIQEYWGLVQHIKSVCDRLASAGFVALAPDLYHGKTTTEPDEATKEMMNLDIEHAASEIDAAVGHLAESTHVNGAHVGVIGFCMGGGLALFAASRNAEIGACVIYYGVGPAREGLDFSAMRAAVQGHWGEKDHSYDHATIETLEKALRDADRHVEMYWYDTDHAFFNDDRPSVHDPAAAELSWERSTAFLRAHLHS